MVKSSEAHLLFEVLDCINPKTENSTELVTKLIKREKRFQVSNVVIWFFAYFGNAKMKGIRFLVFHYFRDFIGRMMN